MTIRSLLSILCSSSLLVGCHTAYESYAPGVPASESLHSYTAEREVAATDARPQTPVQLAVDSPKPEPDVVKRLLAKLVEAEIPDDM